MTRPHTQFFGYLPTKANRKFKTIKPTLCSSLKIIAVSFQKNDNKKQDKHPDKLNVSCDFKIQNDLKY